MQLNKYIPWILVFAVLSACKPKEDPTPTVESPVFACTGTIGGQALALAAGDDGVRMEADVEQGQDDMLHFTGTFTDDAGNAILKIGFRDYKLRSVGEAVDIENVITTGSGIFIDTVTTTKEVYRATFMNTSTSGNNYQWNFGDGSMAATSALGSYVHLYDQEGTYPVTLQLVGGCNASITNSFQIAETGCIVDFDYVSIPDSSGFWILQATPITVQGGAPVSYSWSVNGSLSSDPNLSVLTSDTGMVEVALTVTDDAGCQSSITKQLYLDGSNTGCVANVSLTSLDIITLLSEEFFNNVYVEWTDPAGVLYTTRNRHQSAGSQLQIESVAAYMDNQNGDPTVKVKLLFSCTLYDANGNSVQANGVDATIAVAYVR